MGDLTEKQIIVKITAVDGTVEQYLVNIYREPSELELKSVFVNNRQATRVDNENFTIDIVKGTTNVDLKAILYAMTEYVSIAGNNGTLHENDYLGYDVVTNGKVITIIASNGLDSTDPNYKQKVYKLTLTEVNGIEDLEDLQLTIKVDDNIIAKEPDGIYIAKVDNDKLNSMVEGISSSSTTQVKIDNGIYRVKSSKEKVNLPDDVTKVIITAKNGAGDELEHTLYIVKKDSNAIDDVILKEVKANDHVASMTDDTTYEVSVKAGETKVNLDAIANQVLAFVSVDGNTATRGSNSKIIDMSDSADKVIKVTVTSISGKTKEYTVKIHRMSAISGKVITQAKDQTKQSATIKVYKSQDTRDENAADDPRKIIKEIQINPDGTFILDLEADEYDIVVVKKFYLEYRLTNIIVKAGEDVTVDDINIYAGDLDENAEIEISDLTTIVDHYGTVTDAQLTRYDLNEDGVVDKFDRSILKQNYSKTAESHKWVDPRGLQLMIENSKTVSEDQKHKFILPLSCKYTITSTYGTRKHPTTGVVKKHTGIDIAGDHHADVLAVASGEVTWAGVQNGFGNCVEIKHVIDGEIVYSFYAHLSQINVTKGDCVAQGQVIGLEGGDPTSDPNHGNSTGHHLHFEIRRASGYGNDVDPTTYINF